MNGIPLVLREVGKYFFIFALFSYQVYYVNALDSLEALEAHEAEQISGKYKVVRSPIPAYVVGVFVTPGQEVTEGELLCVIEVMKMETNIRCDHSGLIHSIFIKKGENITVKTPLMLLQLPPLQNEESMADISLLPIIEPKMTYPVMLKRGKSHQKFGVGDAVKENQNSLIPELTQARTRAWSMDSIPRVDPSWQIKQQNHFKVDEDHGGIFLPFKSKPPEPFKFVEKRIQDGDWVIKVSPQDKGNGNLTSNGVKPNRATFNLSMVNESNQKFFKAPVQSLSKIQWVGILIILMATLQGLFLMLSAFDITGWARVLQNYILQNVYSRMNWVTGEVPGIQTITTRHQRKQIAFNLNRNRVLKKVKI